MSNININEMTLEELAEYAVTLDGWEWMPGMHHSYDATQGHFTPDLTDPATLGCLLGMVRERHRAIHVWVAVGAHGYYAVRHRQIEIGPYAGLTNSRPICREDGDLVYYRSAAHALVAALAKEPNE